MPQNWVKYPKITNDQGQPLLWPEDFIPIPKSLKVAFHVASYHLKTKKDVNLAEVGEIASAVTTYANLETYKATTHTAYLEGALDAMEILIKYPRLDSECQRTIIERES